MCLEAFHDNLYFITFDHQPTPLSQVPNTFSYASFSRESEAPLQWFQGETAKKEEEADAKT